MHLGKRRQGLYFFQLTTRISSQLAEVACADRVSTVHTEDQQVVAAILLLGLYRDTSLMKNHLPLEPYSGRMPRTLWWS